MISCLTLKGGMDVTWDDVEEEKEKRSNWITSLANEETCLIFLRVRCLLSNMTCLSRGDRHMQLKAAALATILQFTATFTDLTKE